MSQRRLAWVFQILKTFQVAFQTFDEMRAAVNWKVFILSDERRIWAESSGVSGSMQWLLIRSPATVAF